jgi:hypothetical protein
VRQPKTEMCFRWRSKGPRRSSWNRGLCRQLSIIGSGGAFWGQCGQRNRLAPADPQAADARPGPLGGDGRSKRIEKHADTSAGVKIGGLRRAQRPSRMGMDRIPRKDLSLSLRAISSLGDLMRILTLAAQVP